MHAQTTSWYKLYPNDSRHKVQYTVLAHLLLSEIKKKLCLYIFLDFFQTLLYCGWRKVCFGVASSIFCTFTTKTDVLSPKKLTNTDLNIKYAFTSLCLGYDCWDTVIFLKCLGIARYADVLPETHIQRQAALHDRLPWLLGDDGDTSIEIVYGEEKLFCTGLTRAAKAG